MYQDKKIISKREKLTQQIIHKRVGGESYISSPPEIWKMIVLKNFNRIQRGEISVEQLVGILRENGITFEQTDHLIFYPIRECLLYISKVSNQKIHI